MLGRSSAKTDVSDVAKVITTTRNNVRLIRGIFSPGGLTVCIFIVAVLVILLRDDHDSDQVSSHLFDFDNHVLITRDLIVGIPTFV